MISVPAIRLHQFGVVLYQAILGARDVDRLVRFEVLSYEGGDAAHGARPGSGKRKGKAKPSPVNCSPCRVAIRCWRNCGFNFLARSTAARSSGVHSNISGL